MRKEIEPITYDTQEEQLFWEIAEGFVEDLQLNDMSLIEKISIHLEGKMFSMIDSIKALKGSPQETYESFQESIWAEFSLIINEDQLQSAQ